MQQNSKDLFTIMFCNKQNSQGQQRQSNGSKGGSDTMEKERDIDPVIPDRGVPKDNQREPMAYLVVWVSQMLPVQ